MMIKGLTRTQLLAGSTRAFSNAANIRDRFQEAWLAEKNKREAKSDHVEVKDKQYAQGYY